MSRVPPLQFLHNLLSQQIYLEASMDFRVRSGTAIGGNHLNTVTNGQDALSVRPSPLTGSLIVAVADGCGSQPHSGVGSAIMVRICTTYIEDALRRGQNLTDIRVRRNIRQRLSAEILRLANEMGGDQAIAPIIHQFFLFTLVVMVMTPESTYFLRIGDGMYGYNGKTFALEPTEGNRPIYIAYDITGSPMTNADPSLLDFEVLETVPTKDIDTWWIGTDGMEEIFNAAGRSKVGGVVIETATQMILNPDYDETDQDPKHPTPLSERLAALVDNGNAGDDVTFVGGVVIHDDIESDSSANEDSLDDTPGKAQADDESAPSAGPNGAGTDDPENGES